MGGEKLLHARHLQTIYPPVLGRPTEVLTYSSFLVLLPSFVSFHRRGFIAQIISYFSLSEMIMGWALDTLIVLSKVT